MKVRIQPDLPLQGVIGLSALEGIVCFVQALFIPIALLKVLTIIFTFYQLRIVAKVKGNST